MAEIMPNLSDEQAEEIARKFGVSVEKIREEYEKTKAMGAEEALSEMDGHVASVEEMVQEAADDVAARFLRRDDRSRAIGEFYQEGWDAVPADDIKATTIGDLFLNMSVAIFMLAEAQARINALLDGGHRASGR